MSTMSGGMRPIFCWLCNRPIRGGQYQITAMGPECAGCTTNLETPVDPKLAKDIAAYRARAAEKRAARAPGGAP